MAFRHSGFWEPMDTQRDVDNLNKLVEGKGNYGFYAQTGEYGDLVEMGVIACTLRRAEYLRSPRGRAPLREGRLILLIQ